MITQVTDNLPETDLNHLKSLFNQPGYLVLRQQISSRVTAEQCKAVKALMEDNKIEAEVAGEYARQYADFLRLLDDFQAGKHLEKTNVMHTNDL